MYRKNAPTKLLTCKSGAQRSSISRMSVRWGIPFVGDPQHVTYVWADALNNCSSFLLCIANRGNVIIKCIRPYIGNMLRIANKGIPHRTLMRENRKIFEPRFLQS